MLERLLRFARTQPNEDTQKRRRRGMSLVEVMVVIAIILTLMSVIGVGVMSVFNNSKVDTTVLTMTKVNQRVQIYMLRKKNAPSTSDGLEAVYGGEKMPVDSWGNEFRYVSPGPGGHDFDIMSLGADGNEGGSGNDADLKWSEVGQ
jgi:general secretion pathway protein G